MRIISKFHDYYDVGMRAGYDPSIVMIRVTSAIDDIFNLTIRNRYVEPIPTLLCEKKFLIVLGKCYPFISVVHYFQHESELLYFYSYEDFMKHEVVNEALAKQESRPTPLSIRRHEALKDFFNGYATLNFDEVQIKDKCPIHEVSFKPYTHNCLVERFPVLSRVQFQRVFHPIQLYQELAMWYGNLAAPDLCPVTLSEKDRIAQHGFTKQSFRTRPK